MGTSCNSLHIFSKSENYCKKKKKTQTSNLTLKIEREQLNVNFKRSDEIPRPACLQTFLHGWSLQGSENSQEPPLTIQDMTVKCLLLVLQEPTLVGQADTRSCVGHLEIKFSNVFYIDFHGMLDMSPTLTQHTSLNPLYLNAAFFFFFEPLIISVHSRLSIGY